MAAASGEPGQLVAQTIDVSGGFIELSVGAVGSTTDPIETGRCRAAGTAQPGAALAGAVQGGLQLLEEAWALFKSA